MLGIPANTLPNYNTKRTVLQSERISLKTKPFSGLKSVMKINHIYLQTQKMSNFPVINIT